MKTYTLLLKNTLLLLVALSSGIASFAKTYSIYTAISNGNWTGATTWTVAPRIDGIQKDRFIIPSPFVITADDNVNTQGYIDVELQISGVLQLAAPSTINFGSGSKIEIF